MEQLGQLGVADAAQPHGPLEARVAVELSFQVAQTAQAQHEMTDQREREGAGGIAFDVIIGLGLPGAALERRPA